MMDFIEDAIQRVLPQLQREKVEAVIHELETNLGVEGADALQLIKEEDIRHLLSPIQCRKLINSFKSGKLSHLHVNVQCSSILMIMVRLR